MPAHPRRAFQAILLVLLLAACQPAVGAGPESFAPMIRRVLPAVVNIRITETVTSQDDPFAFLPPELQQQFRERFHSRREKMQGAGAGFIIDPSGYIVTNYHVVGNADQIIVDLADGTELPARVVGTDELTDVALIRVQANAPLPFVTWGNSRSVEVGDWVVAAGNPFGLGGSISAGIVSARGRDIGAGPFDDFIQVDAPINPGNSGGPVFNEQGQVIGIETAIASPTGASVGIGFAIPSEIASRIVTELREHGRVERGWLGISVQDRPAGEAGRAPSGVLVAAVERNGPALRGGLHPGDVVTAVNGQPVDTARGLIRQIAQAAPGTPVRLTLRRQGREMELDITVGRRPNGQG
ncbi:MAG TPA: trypsin-like peptidase domain-containing protein [Acetobacteraceae bacterium]|nr:trypsin-like peptidase domain-containing protein [Acetobacteraceae bacterium]